MSLVLQLDESDTLLLRHQDGSMDALPVPLDWRKQTAEQWFVDDSGIYWQDDASHTIKVYQWADDTIRGETWQRPWPVAIYSSGQGLGYIVQPRQHDTDIVWLQNRR